MLKNKKRTATFMLLLLFTACFLCLVDSPVAYGAEPVKIMENTGTFTRASNSHDFQFTLNQETDATFTMYCHTSGDPFAVEWYVWLHNQDGSYSATFFSTDSDIQDSIYMRQGDTTWTKDLNTLPKGTYYVTTTCPEYVFMDDNYSPIANLTIDYAFELWNNSSSTATAGTASGSTLTITSSPSAWAASDVQAAINEGLIPENLQSNYQNHVTRAEYAQLLTYYVISNYMGARDFAITNSEVWLRDEQAYILMGYTNPNGAFSDAPGNLYVDFVSAAGIVSGVGNGKFDPDGLITREQAAVMMTNATDRQIVNSGQATPYFSDSSSFSSWAASGISFITGVTTYDTNTPVMSGVGYDMFNPRGIFTREEAIVTIYRMYCATIPVVI